MDTDNQGDLFKPTETVIEDKGGAAAPDSTEAKPQRFDTVREALDAAVKEVARDEKGRFAKADDAPVEPDTKPDKTDKTPADAAAPVVADNATTEPSSDDKKADHKAAPTSWSKEAKSLWDSLPPSIQAEVHRREADTAKGVQQLRSRYDALDKVLAPHRQVIQQSGRSEADVVNQLIGWAYALSGPNRLQALQHLNRVYGLPPGSAPAPGGTSQSAISPDLDWQIQQRVTSATQPFQQYMQNQQAAAAEQHVMSWAKDKPHYQAVRETMAQYINADLYALQAGQAPVGGFVRDGQIDLDAAYNAAVYANPETRAAALSEEQAKKAAANKLAVEKARSAAVSVRTGTPSAPANANGKAPKNQSVREAIRDAWAQHRSR